jgi:hypothetical protein
MGYKAHLLVIPLVIGYAFPQQDSSVVESVALVLT